MTNAKSPVPDDRIPVIVGIGEISDHPANLVDGLEPLALLEAALKRAEQDSGAPLLRDIDSLDIVNFLSWRYQDPTAQLSARLNIKPKHAHYGPVGGESPIRFLHEAAQRIARGESSVAAVCGAEAQSTATKAERAGVTLPWTPFAHDAPEPLRGASYQKPTAVKLGVFRPITVYPLYEAATTQIADAIADGNYGYTSWTFWPPEAEQYIISGVEELWLGSATPEQFLQRLQDVFATELAAGSVPPLP